MSAKAASKSRSATWLRITKHVGSSWSNAAAGGISRPRPISRTSSAARAKSRGGCRARRPRTLAIIAYHEPVSRAEIEAIRGVQISKGTLDVLMDAGWVRPAGRREGPGRPLLYATTQEFLTHFGLASRRDLPGIDDLKAAGLLDPLDEAVFQLQLESESEED